MQVGVKEFDTLDPGPARKRVRVERATADDLKTFYPPTYASGSPRIASLETCEQIRRHHPDNIWSIFDQRDDSVLGFYAMTMLTESGLKALLRGDFEAHNPRLAHVASPDQRIHAIFKWGVHAPGMGAAAIPLISEMLNAPAYREIDLYGNGATAAGRRIMLALGFQKRDDPRTPLLYEYRRLLNRRAYEFPPRNEKT